MLRTFAKFLAAFAPVCLLTLTLVCSASDVDDQLLAKRRAFPAIGPGLRALRHGQDGKYYLLASPGVGVVIFDSGEKQLSVVGAADASGHSSVAFGEDCDVDPQGNLYIADRGNNLVLIFARDGKLVRSIT